jgi:hypothetical protein
MLRLLSLILCISFTLSVNVLRGQTTQSNSQPLQSLLVEVRKLRQSIQTTTITGERIQIMLYRLQIQVLALARATQRVDDVRSKLITAEFNRKHEAALVEYMEQLQSHTNDPKIHADREEDLHRRKGEFDLAVAQEQQLRTMESDALAQLQAEQAKLNELQDRLDQLDKTLETLTARKP